MIENDLDLLGQFAREQSQDAFTALVNRHLNLVYSAALRQVRSPQLAEEISQTVFTNLARNAALLKPDTILTAWLYQVTRHTAIDVVRREARRQAREQIAFQMSDMNDTSAGWMRVEPLLDEAMDALEPADRTALLLRYFENKSLREVGAAIGASEDAAQKRVSRAVDRLREQLGKRELTVGASALTALVSAHAVQAAPAGLATAIATGSILTATAISTSTATALTKTIVFAMTTTQKILIATLLAGAIAVGVYQSRQISNLRQQAQAMQQQQQEQQTAFTNQLRELQRAKSQVAALSTESASQKKSPSEVLKLRGEVGRLRQEKNEIGSQSGLSKVTSNPEALKMLRDSQKMGMGMIYKTFAQNAKLTTEQTEKLNDLLADHIMNNVSNVTAVLRDKPAPEQMNQIFAAQEAALQEKVQALIGPDGLAQYQDYTKNILNTLTAQQFKGQMTGDDDAKAEKAKQLSQVIQEETGAVLAAAGLPADYQLVPTLNFRNIASEQDADRNLQLLDNIFQQAAARSSNFLSPDEVAKFQDFKITAIKNNRGILAMNRTMMAPIGN